MLLRILVFVIVTHSVLARNTTSRTSATSATSTKSPKPGVSAARILEEANDYYSSFHLGENKSVILVLGNKDAGKSVLTTFLTTETEKISVKDRLLEFNGGTNVRTTIVPKLMIDLKSNATFYDCPVINDPDIATDITAARSIHELLNFANEIKILFVIKSQSMSNVSDSSDFMKLAENAINLMKDIRKYSDGIALVVRKVEGKGEKGAEAVVYDENRDRELINKCIEFLIKTETQLIRQSFASTDAQRFNIEKINFINALLKNERIKIFRTPMKVEVLKTQKDMILTMINKDLRYVEKDSDDFLCQINPISEQTVPNLINELKNQLTNDMPTSIGLIHKLYIEHETRNLITLNTMKEIISNSSRMNPSELRLPSNIASSKIISYSLAKNIEFFEFLQRFSTNESSRFLNISIELKSQLRAQVQDTFLTEVQSILNEIKHNLVQHGKEFYLEIEVITKIVTDAQQKLSQVRTENSHVFANHLNRLNNELEISGLNGNMRRVSRDLEFMQVLGDENKPMPEKIINEFTQCKEFVDNLQIWYGFLRELCNRLSTYAAQRNKTGSNAPFFDVYIIGNDDDTVEPHIIDLKPALDYLPSITNRSAIENVRVNRYMLKALQAIWSNSWSANTITCTSNRLIVKGNFISINEMIKTASCWTKVKFIDIFALNKVFIDADIDKSGQNVTLAIISPKWEIIMGNKTQRYIRLTGKNAGEPMGPARNGTVHVKRNGDDGLNGVPGGVGGNLLGIGQIFIDDKNLVIDMGGGNGGPGQKGGNGKKTIDKLNILPSNYAEIIYFRCRRD